MKEEELSALEACDFYRKEMDNAFYSFISEYQKKSRENPDNYPSKLPISQWEKLLDIHIMDIIDHMMAEKNDA